jgi:integrase
MSLNPHFVRFVETLKKEGKSIFTQKSYIEVVKQYLERFSTDYHDFSNVVKFIEDLKLLGYKSTTIRQAYYALRKFFKVNGFDFDISYNILPKLSDIKQEAYTKEEIERIVRAASIMPMARLLIELLWYTGARVRQIITLKVDDLEGTKLRINPLKGGLPVVHDLAYIAPPDFIERLKKYIGNRKSGYIFTGKSPNSHISYITVVRIMKDLCKLAGVRYKGIHAIRAGRITYLASRGLSEAELQKLHGYKSPFMVHQYIRLRPEEIEKKVAQIAEPLNITSETEQMKKQFDKLLKEFVE